MNLYPLLPKNSNRSDAPAGLLAEMAKDDKPGGLLGQFDDEQKQEPGGLLDAVGRLFDPRPAADATANLLLNLSPTHIRPTIDPITRETHWLPILRGTGKFLSENIGVPGGFGMRLPGPTASAPVTGLPRAVTMGPVGAYTPLRWPGDRVYSKKENDQDPYEPQTLEDGSKLYTPLTEQQPLLGDAGEAAVEKFKANPTNPMRTARSGTYIVDELPVSKLHYRVWGGDAKKGGPYLIEDFPAGRTQARIDNAILPEWGNTMEKITAYLLPKGTRRFKAISEQQRGDLGHMVGGKNQIYVEYLDPAWEVGTWDFK